MSDFIFRALPHVDISAVNVGSNAHNMVAVEMNPTLGMIGLGVPVPLLRGAEGTAAAAAGDVQVKIKGMKALMAGGPGGQHVTLEGDGEGLLTSRKPHTSCCCSFTPHGSETVAAFKVEKGQGDVLVMYQVLHSDFTDKEECGTE